MNLFPDFKLFLEILRQDRTEHIARFLVIFTNLRAERNELIARLFAIFLNLRPERSARIGQFWLACKRQTYFRSSLRATTGNTSAVRRLGSG